MPTWVIDVLVGWSVIAPLVAVLIGKSISRADREQQRRIPNDARQFTAPRPAGRL